MKYKVKKLSTNIDEFNEVVDEFYKLLNKGDVVLLNGEIGVGKTTFVKRIATNMQIDEIVTSPTYSILKTYDNKLCHIDAYRVSEEDLELDYYIDNDYIIFIEWSDNIKSFLNKITYEINIGYEKEMTNRSIEIKEN